MKQSQVTGSGYSLHTFNVMNLHSARVTFDRWCMSCVIKMEQTNYSLLQPRQGIISVVHILSAEDSFFKF